MLRHKFTLMIVAAAIWSLSVGDALGKTVVVRTCLTPGHIIARPLCPGVHIRPMVSKQVVVAPPHRRVIISPFLSRFVRIWPGHHRRHVAVARKPCIRQVVVTSPVTVWITNSNGSRTAVKLTRSGCGFIGPRGEWYPTMPTNHQLRVVYGF